MVTPRLVGAVQCALYFVASTDGAATAWAVTPSVKQSDSRMEI